jgi:hypothetical protein
MNYTKQIEKDSPRDININETGFYKYLDANGYADPQYPNHAQSPLDDIKLYLGTFGFVKFEDTIDAHILSNLKHIWVYARQVIRRNGKNS